MLENRKGICGGVDTHRDVHMAAVVDTAGRVLGSAPFTTDTAGYEQLSDWLQSHGSVVRVGAQLGSGLMTFGTECPQRRVLTPRHLGRLLSHRRTAVRAREHIIIGPSLDTEGKRP